MNQLDLFSAQPASPVVRREEEGLGSRDAQCGLPLRNYYSKRIFGERLAAYERGYREGRLK